MVMSEIFKGVRMYGKRLALVGVLAGSAVALVKPVQVSASNSAYVCDSQLSLLNAGEIVDGEYSVNGNGKAQLRLETKLNTDFQGNLPNDRLVEPDSATVSTRPATSVMSADSIDPEAIVMKKLGTLKNGKVVYGANVSPVAARNLSKANVTLTNGESCIASVKEDAELTWRANLKKVIERDLSALSYTIVLTK